MHIGFALFAWFVALWSMGYFFWQISADAQTALFWSRALMVGAIFTPVAFLQFVFGLLDISEKRRKFVRWSYVLFSLFLFFNFTPLFVAKVEPALSFAFWPKPGPIYHIFLAIWFFYLLYAAYTLLKHYKNVYDVKREQIKYVLAAMFIAFASGSTNYFLWYNIPIPPFANILVSVYVAIITYAIIRKKLFDIRIVLTQILVGVIAVLLYINILSSQTSFEYLWKGGLLLAFLGAGYLLVKSVMSEIKIRQDLELAYVKLKELDETKTEFISIASHQLRTPLTAVKGYITMILEGTYGKLNPKQKKPIESINDSNERLIHLVNDLLNISRIESGKVKMEWEKTKLEDIIESVVGELEIKAKEKKVRLAFEKPKLPLPSFNMDKEKVRNILLNIIDNAIHYTAKGSITVSVAANPTNRNLETKSVSIAVKDTGEGLEKESMEHLFESFSRGKSSSKIWTEGAGLGLYIAQQFAKMHGGRVTAKSQGKGKGSTFTVELPVQ